MKGYHEYLELHGYFAPAGLPRLGRAEYDALDAEYAALAARHPRLSPDEARRLVELKGRLFRDRP